MMNVLVMLPIPLCAAAFLLLLNPDTKDLVTNRFLWLDLTGLLGQTRLPFTILILLILAGLLILYAVWVSLSPIKPIEQRQRGAKVAGIIFVVALLAVLIEIHAALLRLAFKSQNLIKAPSVTVPGTGKFFEFVFNNAKAFVLYVSLFVLLVLPFLKGLISKATTGESASWVLRAETDQPGDPAVRRLRRPAIALACHDATGVLGNGNCPMSRHRRRPGLRPERYHARRLAACPRFPAVVFRENGLLARRISLVRDSCRRAVPCSGRS